MTKKRQKKTHFSENGHKSAKYHAKSGRLMSYKAMKQSLSFTELAKILSVCETMEDKTLIELAVTTGIRREDIVCIEIMNIDLEARTLTFWEEKKDRPWTVALEPPVAQTLQLYLSTLDNKERYLFPSNDPRGHGHISGRTAYNKFRDLQKKADIKKQLAFHDIRRTFIRLSKQVGRDIRFVMDQTGDKAKTILEEYEGYTLEEMTDIVEKKPLLLTDRDEDEYIDGGVYSKDELINSLKKHIRELEDANISLEMKINEKE